MKILSTELPGVCIIEPVVHADARGWVLESFNQSRWQSGWPALMAAAHGEPALATAPAPANTPANAPTNAPTSAPAPGSAAPAFVQDNHACSRAGVLRGLHYQLDPHAQGKLVRVVSGAAFDVAVDIRPQSAHFGRWVGVELSATNHRQLWVPPGFAHGMLALEEGTQVLYKMTQPYRPSSERSILWNDARIGIRWPLPAGFTQPVVSAKDAGAPTLLQAVAGHSRVNELKS